jgi:predicted adenine nucleotide alpha hydrolase (AANH) superfamily ATPase
LERSASLQAQEEALTACVSKNPKKNKTYINDKGSSTSKQSSTRMMSFFFWVWNVSSPLPDN